MSVYELSTKPDLAACMERVDAWFAGELLDRPPVRFSRHNAEYEAADTMGRTWPSLKERWFDSEYQLDKFEKSLEGKVFLGETFPCFWPNLGPNVFAAGFGCPLEYGEITTWALPILTANGIASNSANIKYDWDNIYLRKLDEMTAMALERSGGRYFIGYTDLHPGLDWCAALRGTEPLLYDCIDTPERVKPLNDACLPDCFKFYDRFDTLLRQQHKQPSIAWMNIPSQGRMHIPSCDFSAMLGDDVFEELAMPGLRAECTYVDHNIFHLDGKGVARHIDQILTLPKLDAIQWVQGMGTDTPIMQWVPLIKKIQDAGKGVVVDVQAGELDAFMEAVRPRGVYLCMASSGPEEEKMVMNKLLKWK